MCVFLKSLQRSAPYCCMTRNTQCFMLCAVKVNNYVATLGSRMRFYFIVCNLEIMTLKKIILENPRTRVVSEAAFSVLGAGSASLGSGSPLCSSPCPRKQDIDWVISAVVPHLSILFAVWSRAISKEAMSVLACDFCKPAGVEEELKPSLSWQTWTCFVLAVQCQTAVQACQSVLKLNTVLLVSVCVCVFTCSDRTSIKMT